MPQYFRFLIGRDCLILAQGDVMLTLNIVEPNCVKEQLGVVFIAKSSREGHSWIHSLPSQCVKNFKAYYDESVFTGKVGDFAFLKNQTFENSSDLLVVGLGSHVNHESLRHVLGQVVLKLSAYKVFNINLHVSTLNRFFKSEFELGRALAEGFLLSAYSYKSYCSKSQKKGQELCVDIVTSVKGKRRLLQGVNEGRVIADATNFARWLGDSPGNFMTPTQLGKEARKVGKGVRVTVWDRARIEKERMGNLLGVSKGSGESPTFIIMEYRGGPASKKPICLVGKGLTFDSGGISLKPPLSMDEMKYDMCGGAAVIGALKAISALKLKVNVIGIVPASENMPGPLANKPGDITVARNGKTTEVNNTDAEGRLILSDALCYASEKKPACIVTTATLTGAIIISLGNIHTGLFTRNDRLSKVLRAASQKSGENVWQLPLTDEHSDDMKGTYADLSNIGSTRGAQSCQAAAFLSEFVDEKIPFAHFDIAGTAWNVGHRKAYHPKKGATGVMVRTFVDFVRLY